MDPLNATRLSLLQEDEQSPLDFLGTRLANLHLIAGASLPFQVESGAAEAVRQAQSAIGGCNANAFCRLFVYQEPRKLMFTENELALFSEYLEKTRPAPAPTRKNCGSARRWTEANTGTPTFSTANRLPQLR